VFGQGVMTPELMWKLGKVSGETITPDGKSVIYGVTFYDLAANKGERNLYSIPVTGGDARANYFNGGYGVGHSNNTFRKDGIYVQRTMVRSQLGRNGCSSRFRNIEGGIDNVKFSPDGKYVLYSKEVKVNKSLHDRYPDLSKAQAYQSDDLMYRHWDTWEDGSFNHVFYANYSAKGFENEKDIMTGEAFDCPQTPFGGAEDITWDALGTGIIYVCKKKSGKEAAVSTNTDLYYYSLANGATTTITNEGKGYDTQPANSPKGTLIAWTSMARDGYEADKNDIVIGNLLTGVRFNLTKDWDGTVESFSWSNDASRIYFLADIEGTEQIFEIALQKDLAKNNGSNIRNSQKEILI
jgi:Tol biopolymer transport system component